MADQVQWRGGSRQNSDGFTGAPREVTVDTTDWILRVHDGIKAGGHKMMKVNDCLVVETADKCDPTAEECKVTINGDLEVDGDTNLGDTIIDGNLIVHGDLLQDGITLAVKTDEVILTNPGAINTRSEKGVCNILPPSPPLKTQEDANQYLDACLLALENAICDFDLTAIDEIQDIKDDLEKVWLAIAGLEVRVANLESDMAAVMARLTLIEQAIALIETEIEAIQNNVTENSKAIEALKVLVADLTQDLNDLEDVVTNLKLDDLTDCAVPAPKDGQQLVFRNGQWVAEDNAFSEQAVHFMGFINVEDDSAPTGIANVKPGDTYIQHKVDETEATANSTWTGIAGEQVSEGQYVMYGADSKWHKGKTVESVDQIQSDWGETDTSSPAFIKRKPDIQGDIDASIGTGDLKIQTSDGVELGTFNANQDNDEVVTLPESFSGDYNDLDNKPTEFPPEDHTHSYDDLEDLPTIPTVNDGKLTVKDSDGNDLGEFTANQFGDTLVTLPAPPAAVSGSQFTTHNNSWTLNFDNSGLKEFGHSHGSGKYLDATLIDNSNEVFALVSGFGDQIEPFYCTNVTIGATPKLNNKSELTRDGTLHNFSVSKFLVNSLMYCNQTSKLMYIAENSGTREVITRDYDEATGFGSPSTVASGNVGVTYWISEDYKSVAYWSFDVASQKLTLTSLSGQHAQQEFDLAPGMDIKEVICMPYIKMEYIYEIDIHSIVIGSVNGGPDRYYLVHAVTGWDPDQEWVDLGIRADGSELLGYATLQDRIILRFNAFALIRTRKELYHVPVRPVSSYGEADIPRIAIQNGYEMYQLADGQQFILKGDEECAMTANYIEYKMSLRTAARHEGWDDTIENAAIQFQNHSRNCRLYSQTKRPDNYASSKPEVDSLRVEPGQIVVDHYLAHGQRFYFAELDGKDEIYALSSECHRY